MVAGHQTPPASWSSSARGVGTAGTCPEFLTAADLADHPETGDEQAWKTVVLDDATGDPHVLNADPITVVDRPPAGEAACATGPGPPRDGGGPAGARGVRAAAAPAGDTAALDEIRWMIEELRVSLFAQQLGTAYPVSEKRIYRALDDLS